MAAVSILSQRVELRKQQAALAKADLGAHVAAKLQESDKELQKFCGMIRHAKDSGDIATLREIAEDRTATSCARAGLVWTSATRRNSVSCGGSTKRCNWKSSASSNH